ncbi:hypothetical protein [Alteromonas sp. a30]|uniref:hypothetical protein n=1 Tax=Alteromonas sp. a30 TaxID=2730917 RepID=UPI0022829469|nr:hypothetical protein [Alteromonas sp. a30]MCY7293825.1 hypothetical protein [Alteromonas sp. a30]
MIKNILQYIVGLVIVLSVVYWLIGTTEEPELVASEQVILQEPYWDTDLEVCNQAKTPVEDSAFESCLALAKNGRVYAQMRVAYLYFDSSEEGHLQESYYWMQRAGHVLEEPLLLSKIMLFSYGTTDEDIEKGYKGIVDLSDKGHSGADAYLATLYFLEENIEQRMANPLWLLEKSYDSGKGYVSPMELVTIYVNGFGTDINIERASKLLFQYADENFPFSTNNTAWFIATTENLPFGSPQKALDLALSVIEDERYRETYPYVDTLAAAYAATGDFDNAVKEQERAIQLLKEEGNGEEAQRDLDSFLERLEQFRSHQAAIYNDIKADSETFFEGMKKRIESGLLGSLKYATYQP